MAAPAFSVIIPVHDAAETLAQTLASLQAQTCTDWEAWLIDDASRDGSMALAKDHAARDARLNILCLPQTAARGAGATRNLGIERARGEFVAFLDADDLWLPHKLETQAQAFAQGADLVFSSYERIDMAGHVLGHVRAAPRVTYRDALSGNPIGCLTAAYRRSRFAQARMPVRALHEDYPFWLSLLRQGVEAQGLAPVLAQYRVRRGSFSGNKLRAALSVWAILRDEGLPLPARVRGFVRYALRSVWRRL